MNGPVIFAILIALTMLILFVAVWRMAPGKDPVTDRLGDYGASSMPTDGPESPPATPTGKRKSATKSVASAYFSALEEERAEALHASILQALKMLR